MRINWQQILRLSCAFVFFFHYDATANLRISEFMASNDSVFTDEDGDSPDWIEIQNTATRALSTSGWFLTDNRENLNRWQLPNIEIPAGGYLVVFASGKDRAGSPPHTDFQLEADGEYLALVAPDGSTVATEINFPRQRTDISFGISR